MPSLVWAASEAGTRICTGATNPVWRDTRGQWLRLNDFRILPAPAPPLSRVAVVRLTDPPPLVQVGPTDLRLSDPGRLTRGATKAEAGTSGARRPLGVVTGKEIAMTDQSFGELRELAQQLRVDSVRCSTSAGSGHPTSSMSAADVMAVLLARHFRYDWDRPDDPANDHLIFSKGHASPLLYSMFKAAGVITDEELMTGYRRFGSRPGRPSRPLCCRGWMWRRALLVRGSPMA